MNLWNLFIYEFSESIINQVDYIETGFYQIFVVLPRWLIRFDYNFTWTKWNSNGTHLIDFSQYFFTYLILDQF